MRFPPQGSSGSRWESYDATTITPKGGKGIRVTGTTTFAGAVVASGAITWNGDVGVDRASAGALKVTDGGAGYGKIRPSALSFGAAGGAIDVELSRTSVGTIAWSAGDAYHGILYNDFIALKAAGAYAWSGGDPTVTAADLFLYRDAAGVLAQRNAGAAQAFRLYNTYTGGGANYEYGYLAWTANVFYLGTYMGGTGGARSISVNPAGGLLLGTSNTTRWSMAIGEGHFTASGNYAIRGGAGTEAAPSLSTYGDPDSGMFAFGANILGWSTGGTARLALSNGGLVVASNMAIGWSGGAIGAADGALLFYGGTPGIIEHRLDATACALRIYNTYTGGGANYEYGALYWDSNTLTLGTASGGTGAGRAVRINATGTLTIAATGGIMGVGGGSDRVLIGFPASGGLRLSNPSDTDFAYLDLAGANAELRINGTKVVDAQGAAVADASGGATVDAEARTAINTLLARLRTHGLIAT